MRPEIFAVTVFIASAGLSACASGNPSGMENPGAVTDTIVERQITKDYIEIEETEDLRICYPEYSAIDLAFDNMPEKSDSSVIFCCSASFTGQLLDTFNHFNIAGNHVSSGKYYKGYPCKANTGCFVYYSGKWQFLLKNYKSELLKAAENGGMGFCQNMIVFNNVIQPSFRNPDSKFEYRALCEYNGRLCIIDSKGIIPYKDFIAALDKIKVRYALYMDMGSGWNYSWYRMNNDSVVEIHPKGHNYTTNWLVFKK